MVTSNRVLTGLVGYRSLELALLELTLFQTVPREMETHSPLDGRPHHPAGPQAGRRLLAAAPDPGFCRRWTDEKQIRLVVGWE